MAISIKTLPGKPAGVQLEGVSENLVVPVVDAQISGVADDGTPEGVIRAMLVNKELFKFHASDFSYSGSNITYADNGLGSNKGRGLDSFIALQVDSASTSFGFSAYVYGKAIGLRFLDNSYILNGGQFPDATIVVDGTPYRLWDAIRIVNPPMPAAGGPGETVFFIPEILSESWHKVDIIIHRLPTGVHVCIFYGFVAQKSPLQIDLAHQNDSFFRRGELTTSSVPIPFRLVNGSIYNAAPSQFLYKLKRIIYYNSDLVARVVTVTYASQVILNRSIPAGETFDFNLSSDGIGFRDSDDFAALTHKVNGVDPDPEKRISFTTIGSVL